MRTLIVDDDLVSRRILQRLLASYGECHAAANGREAVEAFSLAHADREPYDLVCLDIMMPEMDGQACLKELRRIETELKIASAEEAKIFMVSALDGMQTVAEAYYDGGCSAYLVKPISWETLLSALREHRLIE